MVPGTKQKREICSLQVGLVSDLSLSICEKVKKPQSGPKARPALPSLLDDRVSKGGYKWMPFGRLHIHTVIPAETGGSDLIQVGV